MPPFLTSPHATAGPTPRRLEARRVERRPSAAGLDVVAAALLRAVLAPLPAGAA